MTTDYTHPESIQSNIAEVVMDWLAAGLDPERSTFVLQSAVKEHAELALLFSMLVTVSRVERNPTYKEQVRELGLIPSLGLLTYPVLQAADILIYEANAFPVGEDQLPHLEITHEIARRFNGLYGQTFPEPRGLLSHVPRLPGTDGRTMHTSYGNTIPLSASPDEIERAVMNMITDRPASIPPTSATLRSARSSSIIWPFRRARQELADRPDYLRDILREGTARARPIAQATMEEVREKMGLN